MKWNLFQNVWNNCFIANFILLNFAIDYTVLMIAC
jgi:hypothetical protein